MVPFISFKPIFIQDFSLHWEVNIFHTLVSFKISQITVLPKKFSVQILSYNNEDFWKNHGDSSWPSSYS